MTTEKIAKLATADTLALKSDADGGESLLLADGNVAKRVATPLPESFGGTGGQPFIKSYTTRNADNAAAGYALGDGVAWFMDGLPYINQTGGAACDDLSVTDIAALGVWSFATLDDVPAHVLEDQEILVGVSGYVVAASAATDHDETTGSGVKLYIQSVANTDDLDEAVAGAETAEINSQSSEAAAAVSAANALIAEGAAQAHASGAIYADEATGRAAVADDEYFFVEGSSADGFYDLHQRIDAGTVTTSSRTYPTYAFVEPVRRMSGNDALRSSADPRPASGERQALVETARARALGRLRRDLTSVAYCDPNATGTADGSSWTNAFTDMNAACAALSDGGTLYTNAPAASPFPKQEITDIPDWIEWISNEGSDGITWIDGRNFGTWTESSGVFSTAVVTEPEFAAYDFKQDDTSGTVTGIDLTTADAKAVVDRTKYTDTELVAWYGFLEKEASATTTPSEGKWSWVTGTLYVNPTGTPSLTNVNDLACWSDPAAGVKISSTGDAYRGLYHHGDLRTLFTPSREAGQGYGVRLTAAQQCTFSDTLCIVAGYHSVGAATDSLDQNTLIHCVSIGQVPDDVSPSKVANPFVFYSDSVDYADAQHLGLALTALAFPPLKEDGSPLILDFSPALGLSHTAGTTTMDGVRWVHCDQKDFVDELMVKHTVTIAYTVGSVSASNTSDDPPDIDDPNVWPVSAWDCSFTGRAACINTEVDYRNCYLDRLGYGDATETLLTFTAPTGDDAHAIRMIGGAWKTGLCLYIMLSHDDDDASAFRGVHIDISATGTAAYLFRSSTTTSDIRLGGCRITCGDSNFQLAILTATAWGSGLENLFTSEGGNIYDAKIEPAYRHTNGAVAAKTMAEFLALTDTNQHDVAGYV